MNDASGWDACSAASGTLRLVNRSGRFEDLFVRAPVTARGPLSVTVVGQFRTMTQVDVSQRFSLSEPLVFSSSVAAVARASTARVTNLRAFSASGRQPGLRAEYQVTRGDSPADGWVAGATLPLTGQLTIPFSDARVNTKTLTSWRAVEDEAERLIGQAGPFVATRDMTGHSRRGSNRRGRR